MSLRIRAPRRPPPRAAAADPLAAATARAASLTADPLSAALAAAAARTPSAPPPPPTAPALAAAAATADAALLAATELVCVEPGVGGGGEYRQVVLVGPGLDTRAMRLPWPRGVVLYDVAPADAHAVAAAATAGGGRSPPGTLHIRVAADAAADGDDVAAALAAAGHRGDRLTAAALSLAHLPRDAVRRTLASVACAGARWSLVSGDVAAASAADAQNVLAEAGVAARVEGVGGGVYAFTGQLQWLSDAERETLAAHAEAADDAEGFEGNVS